MTVLTDETVITNYHIRVGIVLKVVTVVTVITQYRKKKKIILDLPENTKF